MNFQILVLHVSVGLEPGELRNDCIFLSSRQNQALRTFGSGYETTFIICTYQDEISIKQRSCIDVTRDLYCLVM